MIRYSEKAQRAKNFVDFRRDFQSASPLPMDRGPMPYALNIDTATVENENFRTVLWTGAHLQTTLMSISAGGEIPVENHEGSDQMLYIVRGEGEVIIEGEMMTVRSGYAVFIPAGKTHRVKNTSGRELKLFSVYAPPIHRRGSVDKDAI